MKKLIFVFVIVLMLFSLTNCEMYTTAAKKIYDYKGEVPNPTNTTPYSVEEIQQQLAIRSDHVCVMFAKDLTIGDNDVEYVAINGGKGGKSTASILFLASNGKISDEWPTPGKDANLVQCQIIGELAGVTVWGVIIPRSFFVNTLLDDDTLVYSWKFVWGSGWDGNEQAGVSPFINPADYNNCTARLYASDYITAATF